MPRSQSIHVFAPAKVNLTLHVTGQREDGYHLLDSLVVFADCGDVLRIEPGASGRLVTSGPEAEKLGDVSDNLITKVARLFEDGSRAAIFLEKNLPVSSGIGGGSTDAAAAFRGLATARYGVESIARLAENRSAPLLALGADIPMCLACEPVRVAGIGDVLRPLPAIPRLHAVLVNPRLGVSTPQVFKALACKENSAMPEVLPRFVNAGDCMSWLATQRNDLETAARQIEPTISEVQNILAATEDCRLVRMSGSGATCFGLYPDMKNAQAAASEIRGQQPDWWVEAVELGTQAERARPKVT